MNKKDDFNEFEPIKDEFKKSTSFNSSGTNKNSKSPDLTSFSPYLNYNPAYFPPSQPEFIFLDGAVKQRGRFELAFCQIGAACVIGAGIGGLIGLRKGFQTLAVTREVGKLKRTQLINHLMKHGSSLGNSFGVISLMYSGFGVIFSWARNIDDYYNTIAAATATGMLFKSTAGLKKCITGGIFGFGISTLYSICSNKEILTDIKQLPNRAYNVSVLVLILSNAFFTTYTLK